MNRTAPTSTFAPAVDALSDDLALLTAATTALVVAFVLATLIRRRRRAGLAVPPPPDWLRHTLLFMAVQVVVLGYFFHRGFALYVDDAVPPISAIAYASMLREGPPIPDRCQASANPDACWGEALYRGSGCIACHSTDPGTTRPGPSWATVLGATRTFTDGSSLVGDEAYVKESIHTPSARIVSGYEGFRMPPTRLSDGQVHAIVAFMETLRR